MDNLNAVLLFGTILAPIILAALEGLKRAIPIPRNSVPLVAVVVGMLIGLATYKFTDLDWSLRLWSGALAGLSSTGLFELVLSNRPGTTKE